MSAMLTTGLPVATLPVPHPHPHLRLRCVVRRLGVNLLVACLIPAVVFISFMLAFDVWAALFAALTWSYLAIAWQVATDRRRSGMLVLTATAMTLKTGVALASGSTFLYFLQPIATDALIATVFFGSLATARPVVSRLAGDFYPMDAELAARPRIRRLFRHLTFLWAALCLTKAVMTYWLLKSQSVETFVVFKSASVLSLNALAIAATVCAAVLVARKEGLLGAPLNTP